MRVHRMTLLLSAFLLAIAAPATASAKSAPPMVPFKMTGITIDSYALPTEAPTCPDGTFWRYYGDGTVTATHLGRSTFHMTHCTYITVLGPDGPLAGVTGPGVATVTAANGDQLWLSYRAEFHVELRPDGLFSVVEPMTWTITGGTGRFLHATGEGTARALGDIFASTTTATWTGMIQYAASDRAGE